MASVVAWKCTGGPSRRKPGTGRNVRMCHGPISWARPRRVQASRWARIHTRLQKQAHCRSGPRATVQRGEGRGQNEDGGTAAAIRHRNARGVPVCLEAPWLDSRQPSPSTKLMARLRCFRWKRHGTEGLPGIQQQAAQVKGLEAARASQRWEDQKAHLQRL